MKKENIFKLLYLELFKINDSPQKIALGLGLGVFSGIFPGTGPLAALFLAFLLRANRASALLGSLLTNTWLSFVTFLLAIKLGSALFGVSWQKLQQDWASFLSSFSWLSLFKTGILKIILPVIAGYLLIAFCLGLLVYLTALLVLQRRKT
ncbi:MAG: DUF2062 domain-containing protein [Candidatus Omnitrophota bacterium]